MALVGTRAVFPPATTPARVVPGCRAAWKPATKAFTLMRSAQRRKSNAGRIAVVQVDAAAVLQDVDYKQLAEDLDLKSPLEIIDYALERFGNEVAIAFSGAEDVAVIEYAHLTGRPFRVFSLDTGRLHPETYQLFDAVEKHYGIRIEYTFPDAEETMNLVRTKGMFSFYKDGHQECCRIRKVKPLRKQLKTLKAWITGQRKDQSPGTRAGVPVVEVDPVFDGITGGHGSLVKFNPMSNITSQEVWNFLRVMDVPTNALHAKGYVSLGCEPCTRPVLPNQHEREGRWWWEDATGKECGLHSGNSAVSGDNGVSAAPVRTAERDLWEAGRAVEALSRARLEELVAGKSDKPTLVVLYAPWCPYSQGMEEAYEELAQRYGESGDVRVAKFQADIERDFSVDAFQLKTFPTIVLLSAGKRGFLRYPSERRDPDTLDMWVRSLVGYE